MRQPCHNTGLAGLKPTHGRIPRTGSVFGDAWGIFGQFNCYGPLARSVRDLYLALSIMNGPDLRDPYAVPAPLGNPDDVDVTNLRVATYLDDGISRPDDDVARRRLADVDAYRVEMLTFMADYDVIVGPAMPTAAKPHHHRLVEISDFSHLMVHNLTGWPAAVIRCGTSKHGLPIGVQVVARPWQDATALAVAGHLEKVFGGWRSPPMAGPVA
ncbi:amidase family protein [Mycolicibacterium sp. XJ879]